MIAALQEADTRKMFPALPIPSECDEQVDHLQTGPMDDDKKYNQYYILAKDTDEELYSDSDDSA